MTKIRKNIYIHSGKEQRNGMKKIEIKNEVLSKLHTYVQTRKKLKYKIEINIF